MFRGAAAPNAFDAPIGTSSVVKKGLPDDMRAYTRDIHTRLTANCYLLTGNKII